MKNRAILAAGVLSIAATLSACEPNVDVAVADDGSVAAVADERLTEALGAELRGSDGKRDKFRNPGETLAFFGLASDQTVIEYAPGGGWYTRILAPYLSDNGSYIAVGFAPDGIDSLGPEFQARVREASQSFSETQAEALDIPAEKLPFYYGNAIPAELNGTVDLVLIFRMMHNLMRWDIAASEIAALRDTLKPDGMVGVVQHRAPADAADDFADGNAGYLKQADVIAFFESNGFELVGTSEANANPADTADHEAGVWTLPPTFALGDKGREKYAEIGESDRMTLLFRKAS